MKGDSEPMLISNYEFGDNSLLFPDRPIKSHNSDEKRDFRKKHNNEKNVSNNIITRFYCILLKYINLLLRDTSLLFIKGIFSIKRVTVL